MWPLENMYIAPAPLTFLCCSFPHVRFVCYKKPRWRRAFHSFTANGHLLFVNLHEASPSLYAPASSPSYRIHTLIINSFEIGNCRKAHGLITLAKDCLSLGIFKLLQSLSQVASTCKIRILEYIKFIWEDKNKTFDRQVLKTNKFEESV